MTKNHFSFQEMQAKKEAEMVQKIIEKVKMKNDGWSLKKTELIHIRESWQGYDERKNQYPIWDMRMVLTFDIRIKLIFDIKMVLTFDIKMVLISNVKMVLTSKFRWRLNARHREKTLTEEDTPNITQPTARPRVRFQFKPRQYRAAFYPWQFRPGV